MSFLAPAFGALAAVAALIIVQYFLKLRRPVRTLPSTFLWQRALADTRANAPWQRLRADPLLLLQVLALLILVVALMRPYVLRAGAVSQNVVAVLDASLSSQMTDTGSSRFAAEVASIRNLIADLPPGHTMSLIRMDSHPRVLIATSSDHGALDDALNAQRPGYDQPDVRAALSLAYGLAGQSQGGGPQTLVQLYRSATTVLPSLQGGPPTQDQAYGRADAPNLGIAGFAAAKQADGSVSAIIRVINTGKTTLSTDIEVRADGKLWDDLPSVTVAPGDSQAVSSTGLPGSARVLQATLTLHDTLAADNTAWTVLNTGSVSRVLLVTNGNIFLTAALTVLPNVQISQTTPTKYTAGAAANMDAVIFDGWLPPALPASNLLLIGPPASGLGEPPLGIAASKDLRTAGMPRVDDDPAGLLRYTTPSNIHISRTLNMQAPGWAHVALRDSSGPLLLEAAQGPAGSGIGRIAIVGFDVHQSDVWASLDFPVLMSNLLGWLTPGLNLNAADFKSGDVVHIGIAAGTRQATVLLPDGQTQSLLTTAAAGAPDTVPFADTAQPGVYTVGEQLGRSRLQALFSVNSSASNPVLDGGDTLAATASSHQARNSSSGQVPVELTGGVASVVLVVLAAEWFVAMRRR